MKPPRVLVMGLIAGAALASLGAVTVAPPATASVISDFKNPTTPTGYMLNLLPKVGFAAVTGETRVLSEAQAAGLLLNQFRYSDKWTPLKKKYGPKIPASVDGADMQLIGDLEKQFTPPASKFQTLNKVAGGAATAVSVVGAGFALGKSVDQMLGFDVEGTACGGAPGAGWDIANKVLSVLTATDCDKWQMTQQMLAAANKDVAASAGANAAAVGSVSCTPDGSMCATITSITATVPAGAQSKYYCARVTKGPNTSTYPLVWNQVGNKAAAVNYVAGGPSYCPSTGSVSASGFPVVMYGSPVVSWQAFYSPAAVPATFPSPPPDNPQRTYRCDVTLSNGVTINQVSPAFTEADGAVSRPVCPAVPDEAVPLSTKVVEQRPGVPDVEVIPATPTTPEYQDWKQSYPECGNGSCALYLLRDGQRCDLVDNGAACADWFTDPNKDTVYSCTYGDHVVALSECNAYAPLFKPNAIAQGTPYGDPITGAPVEGRTTTGLDTQIMHAPAVDPDTGTSQCFPTGWGRLNPLEWVVRPVVCALNSAFIPRSAVVTAKLDDVKTAWAATPPGVLVGYFEDMREELPTLGGCSGPHVDFAIDFRPAISWAYLHVQGDPLSACDPPWSGLAAATRVLFATTVLYGAFRAITAYIGGIVGFKGFGKAV